MYRLGITSNNVLLVNDPKASTVYVGPGETMLQLLDELAKIGAIYINVHLQTISRMDCHTLKEAIAIELKKIAPKTHVLDMLKTESLTYLN